jgi:hypothetical protein
MKKSVVLLATVILVALVMPVMAQESILPPNANKTLIEDNLFVGLSSNNAGLQRSCALMLGKIQSDRAVIPLMTAFHNNTNENVRIATAWALCKIGDSRGVYAVKMGVKYDECPKVQATCAWYYENFVEQGTFTFIQPEELMVAITK